MKILDQYFSNPDAYYQPESRGSSAGSVDRRKIQALFDKYKGILSTENNFRIEFSDPAETPVKIGLEGVERICEDLELDPVIFKNLKVFWN